MANDVEQQIFNSLNKARRILIALPENLNGDAAGAGLACLGFLRKLEKEAVAVSSVADLGSLKFLPGSREIKRELEVYSSFVISVKTAQVKLDELSYEVKPDRVDIFLKPAAGTFTKEDISFRSGKFPYDLIITLDSPSLEHLGSIYEKNTDLFFETAVINIDHHPANEQYGEINLVDLTATSTSEILAGLIEDFEAELIDADIATNLLTGIVVETNSFQHVKTTPKAFLRASGLIARGGRHQDIIRELYKTKRISLLKLWGRTLARVKEVPELDLTYSLLNTADFEKSGSSEAELLDVMKELVANLTGRRMIFLLAEAALGKITGLCHLHPSLKTQIVMSALNGQMRNGSLGRFEISGKSLQEAEAEVLDKLSRLKEQIAPGL